MALAFRSVGSAIAQIYCHFGVALASNLAAFLVSVPVLLLLGAAAYPSRSWSLIPLGGALLLGILPNPGAVALQCVARELAHDEDVNLGRQLRMLRRHAAPALKCWLSAVAVTAVIVANVAFYARSTLAFAGSLQVLWALILWLWLSVHLYVFPLLLDQDVKSVRAIYRNAFVILFARPLFTIIVAPIWVAALVFTCATGLATVVGLAAGASIQQNAFAHLLPTFSATKS